VTTPLAQTAGAVERETFGAAGHTQSAGRTPWQLRIPPALRPPALRRSGRFQALLRAVGDALTGITRAVRATFAT